MALEAHFFSCEFFYKKIFFKKTYKKKWASRANHVALQAHFFIYIKKWASWANPVALQAHFFWNIKKWACRANHVAPQAHFLKKLLKKILILLVQPRGPAGSQLGNQAYSKNSCAKHFSPRSCPTVQSESSEGLTDCQASNWGFPNKAVWPQNLSGRGPLI